MIGRESNWIQGKHLINFSQRKVINDTSIAIHGQLLKVTQSVEFLGVTIDSHLNMKLDVEHIERACLVNRIRVARLNSTNATLLIRLYETFIRPQMDYACTALTEPNKSIVSPQ